MYTDYLIQIINLGAKNGNVVWNGLIQLKATQLGLPPEVSLTTQNEGITLREMITRSSVLKLV